MKELKDLSCEVVDKSKEFVYVSCHPFSRIFDWNKRYRGITSSMEIDKIYSYAKVVAQKYLIADLSDEGSWEYTPF